MLDHQVAVVTLKFCYPFQYFTVSDFSDFRTFAFNPKFFCWLAHRTALFSASSFGDCWLEVVLCHRLNFCFQSRFHQYLCFVDDSWGNGLLLHCWLNADLLTHRNLKWYHTRSMNVPISKWRSVISIVLICNWVCVNLGLCGVLWCNIEMLWCREIVKCCWILLCEFMLWDLRNLTCDPGWNWDYCCSLESNLTFRYSG